MEQAEVEMRIKGLPASTCRRPVSRGDLLTQSIEYFAPCTTMTGCSHIVRHNERGSA